MSKQIAKTKTEEYVVSTVQTQAGGAAENRANALCPFSESDYDTPWPYETIVFKLVGAAGQYHEAHESEAEALEGHKRIVEMVERTKGRGNTAHWLGQGVSGFWGNPSLTGDQWRALQHVKTCPMFKKETA